MSCWNVVHWMCAARAGCTILPGAAHILCLAPLYPVRLMLAAAGGSSTPHKHCQHLRHEKLFAGATAQGSGRGCWSSHQLQPEAAQHPGRPGCSSARVEICAVP